MTKSTPMSSGVKDMQGTISDRTVFSLLEEAYASCPDKEVIFDQYRRMTYRELYQESLQMAAGLSRLGVNKGDRVAVCLPNWHEFVIILFALTKIGAVLVPVNIRYRAAEIQYILENSEAKVAFIAEKYEDIHHFSLFRSAGQKLNSLQHLITVRFKEEGYTSYEELLKTGESLTVDEAAIRPADDLFSILYTSGTTGLPKGAMLTHRNVVNIARLAGQKMQCTPDDVYLIPVPVLHVMGLMFILRAVTYQGKLVLMEKYKAEEALRLIQDERVTVHPGVPTMFILELNHPNFKAYDLSSLRTGEMAAAPCPVEIVRRIRTEMNCDVLVAYGMTETSATLTMADFSDPDEYRAETVGRALPGMEIKIVDDKRREVPRGEVGELACRSVGLMKGYYKREKETREAIDEEGWFYSGDLATMDEQGYVRIVGRKKEMIIRGGFNIYPREIEEIFYTHPSVMEVAIVGIPDEVLGERSCAAIRLKPGQKVTEEELKAFIKGKVADYKVPDLIVFVDQFPMTATGKISKVNLRQELIDRLNLGKEA